MMLDMAKKTPPVPPEISAYFRELGKKNGAAGAKKAAENMTPEERTARAKKAVAAREAKRKKPSK